MSELKYNPNGYLYSELKPKHGEIVLFQPYEGAIWREGQIQACGFAERFPDGRLKFPSWISVYQWKYPPLEDQQRIRDEIKAAYWRK